MINMICRAKLHDTREWKYGYYAKTVLNEVAFNLAGCRKHDLIIDTGVMYYVDYDTVGRRTGAKYEGEDIYEGDLFKIEGNWPIYEVVFNEELSAFGLKSPTGPFYSFESLIEKTEVLIKLGNKHDNPDLLESEPNET